jgi:uncharacterized protein YbjT (DUF2867 family)
MRGEREAKAALQACIPFTFVQPTGFMSYLLAWAHSIRQEGIVRSSTGDGRRAFIHSDNIAAVSVEAMLSERYIGHTLPITGPKATTFGEATDAIGAAIGKVLRYQAISDEEAGERYSEISGSPEETQALVDLWKTIREDRLATVTDCVERVLGKKPIRLEKWAVEYAHAFRE